MTADDIRISITADMTACQWQLIWQLSYDSWCYPVSNDCWWYKLIHDRWYESSLRSKAVKVSSSQALNLFVPVSPEQLPRPRCRAFWGGTPTSASVLGKKHFFFLQKWLKYGLVSEKKEKKFLTFSAVGGGRAFQFGLHFHIFKFYF